MKSTAVMSVGLLLGSILSFAQDRGSITGTVTDTSGAALARASVLVTNTARGETINLESTTTGQYSASNLIPGTYEVRVEASGFAQSIFKGIDVKVAEVTRLDVRLKLGNIAETVNVTSESQILKTDASDIGTSIESSLLSTLPLQVGGAVRDPLAFTKLTPGFNGQTANSAREYQSYYTVNGGQSGATQILVDGADVQLTSVQSQYNTGVSVDAVEEFKVMSSNFSAEYGRSTGGIINLSLKSGTNQFHGSAFDYLRNDVLDAKGFFNPERLENRQNDFGLTFSGPVWIPKIYNGHSKTFFFFAYEGFRYRQGALNSLITLPIDSFRHGDFSQLVDANGDQIPIYDPASTVVHTDGTVERQQFPGNIIPSDRIDSFAQLITERMPALSFPSQLTSNVFQPLTNLFDTGIKTLKIDHTIAAKHKLTGSYSQADENDIGHVWNDLSIARNSGVLQHTKYARLAHDFIISPTILNHIQIGVSRRWRQEGGISRGEVELPLPNGDCTPLLLTAGYDLGALGISGGTCSHFTGADTSIQLREALTMSVGRHTLKFGGEMRKQRWDVNNLQGIGYMLSFDPTMTALPGSSSASGDGFASFLLGAVSSGVWSDVGNLSRHRFSSMSLYAQDDFKATSRLTLNVGLRYDLFWPLSDAQGRLSAFDPTVPNPGADGRPGALIFAGSGNGRTGSDRFQQLYKRAFGPRIGFAYGVNDRTVIRAGYGLYYQELKEPGWGGSNDGFFTQRSFSSADGYSKVFQLADGLDINFPVGTTIDPALDNGLPVNYANPRSGRPPIAQNWQLSIQRQLGSKLTIDAAYVATKGNHLVAANQILNQVDPKYLALGSLLDADINSPEASAAGISAPFAGFTGTVAQALRPYPQFQDVLTANIFGADKSGNSTYHSFQLKVQGQVANSLHLTLAYTFSKNLTDNANNRDLDVYAANYYASQNGYDPKAEKTYASMDIPHILNIGYVYELPFGTGKRLLNGGWQSKIVGGWSLSGVLSYQSGLPIPSPHPASFHVPLFAGSIRPNRLMDQPLLSASERNGTFNVLQDSYLNPNAWESPTPFHFGNASGMSGARVPAMLNEDLAVSKRFTITERVSSEFRAEAFNLLNRTVFGFPNLDLGSSGFGMISTQRNSPRTMQVSLKVLF